MSEEKLALMTKETEERLLGALTRAVSISTQGGTPNEAIAKVAAEESLSPEFARRMVESFNISKSLAHRRVSEGDEKAASHELADARGVLDTMYPEDPKTDIQKKADATVPPELNMPEVGNFNESVRTIPPIPYKPLDRKDRKLEDAMAKHAKAKRAADQLYTDWSGAYDRMVGTIKAAADQFRRVDNSIPFDRAEEVICQTYGQPGKCLMGAIYSMADGTMQKTAGWSRFEWSGKKAEVAFDPNQSPYKEILTAKKAAEDFVFVFSDKAAAALNDLKDQEDNLPPSFFPKAAQFSGMLSALNTLDSLKSVRDITRSSKDPAAISKRIIELTDPLHDAEMQGIREQAILSDLMANDPVISSYDPSAVTTAFNEIAQLVPKAAEQPLILRGLLRKRLQQEAFTEFEAQQLVSTEEKLRKSEGEEMAKVPELPKAEMKPPRPAPKPTPAKPIKPEKREQTPEELKRSKIELERAKAGLGKAKIDRELAAARLQEQANERSEPNDVIDLGPDDYQVKSRPLSLPSGE